MKTQWASNWLREEGDTLDLDLVVRELYLPSCWNRELTFNSGIFHMPLPEITSLREFSGTPRTPRHRGSGDFHPVPRSLSAIRSYDRHPTDPSPQTADTIPTQSGYSLPSVGFYSLAPRVESDDGSADIARPPAATPSANSPTLDHLNLSDPVSFVGFGVPFTRTSTFPPYLNL